MSAKLIATTFTYRQAFDGYALNTGSYLGRKAASVATIRRFLRRNAKELSVPAHVREVNVTGSYVSPWISK
jgi:hypothetical protein